MAGNGEMRRHFSDYDATISSAQVRKREYYDRGYDYIRGLCSEYCIFRYEVRGNMLHFKYNVQTPVGIKTIHRYVNLDTGVWMDKPGKIRSKADLFWDGNRFVPMR